MRKILSVLGVSIVACGCAAAPPNPPKLEAQSSRPVAPVAAVLTTHALWGKDFPALLASLRAWSRAGEPSIVVFADHVTGVTPYRTANDAKQRLENLSKALTERPTPVPPFVELLQGVKIEPYRTELIRFPDDGSYRTAWTGSGLEFLAKGLTTNMVHAALGPPQSVRRQAMQEFEGGEARPVILTLHSYAGGAVVFAESEWMPPGTVDRVLLDVAAASEAVFGGTR